MNSVYNIDSYAVVSYILVQPLGLYGLRTSVNWENSLLQILVCVNLGKMEKLEKNTQIRGKISSFKCLRAIKEMIWGVNLQVAELNSTWKVEFFILNVVVVLGRF
jgi:hypothetical protein